MYYVYSKVLLNYFQDVIFHNEAYSQSSGSGSGRVSSVESSPEHTKTSGAAGFMAAVLNAIRSATTMRNSHSVTGNADHEANSLPCSMNLNTLFEIKKILLSTYLHYVLMYICISFDS